MGAPPMNTLPARLRTDGNALQVVIGDGAATLPISDADGRLAPYHDAEVVLGIRPECIAESQRRFGDEQVVLEATVEMTEPTGAETIVMLRIAGDRAIGRVAPDTRLSVGRVERFSIDTRKLCLFDPKTERLIV
jgi:multiple sugar transport system ATP-binding protein